MNPTSCATGPFSMPMMNWVDIMIPNDISPLITAVAQKNVTAMFCKLLMNCDPNTCALLILRILIFSLYILA